MLKLEARLWPAPPAFSSTHICKGGTVAKGGGAEQCHEQHGQPLAVQREAHQAHHQRQQQAAEQGRHQLAVGELAADQITDHQTEDIHVLYVGH